MQLAFIKCKQIKEAHFNEQNLNVMTSESKHMNISNYHTDCVNSWEKNAVFITKNRIFTFHNVSFSALDSTDFLVF